MDRGIASLALAVCAPGCVVVAASEQLEQAAREIDERLGHIEERLEHLEMSVVELHEGGFEDEGWDEGEHGDWDEDEVFVKMLHPGKGTIGKLHHDDELYERLRELHRRLRRLHLGEWEDEDEDEWRDDDDDDDDDGEHDDDDDDDDDDHRRRRKHRRGR